MSTKILLSLIKFKTYMYSTLYKLFLLSVLNARIKYKYFVLFKKVNNVFKKKQLTTKCVKNNFYRDKKGV